MGGYGGGMGGGDHGRGIEYGHENVDDGHTDLVRSFFSPFSPSNSVLIRTFCTSKQPPEGQFPETARRTLQQQQNPHVRRKSVIPIDPSVLKELQGHKSCVSFFFSPFPFPYLSLSLLFACEKSILTLLGADSTILRSWAVAADRVEAAWDPVRVNLALPFPSSLLAFFPPLSPSPSQPSFVFRRINLVPPPSLLSCGASLFPLRRPFLLSTPFSLVHPSPHRTPLIPTRFRRRRRRFSSNTSSPSFSPSFPSSPSSSFLVFSLYTFLLPFSLSSFR